jgi:hypothetical protein
VIELVLAALVAAQSPVPSLREQAAIQQEWLKAQFDKVFPAAMRTSPPWREK